jgi:hypothetical protein
MNLEIHAFNSYKEAFFFNTAWKLNIIAVQNIILFIKSIFRINLIYYWFIS